MDDGADLIEAFALHAPDGLQDRVREAGELAVVLAASLEAIRSAWPEVQLSPATFLGYLAERLDPAREPLEGLHALRVGDLFLAWACARGDEQALRIFETHYGPPVERALRRMGLTPETIDEVFQRLRRKLLVAEADAPPEITKYAGRGGLGGWVRVTAVRLALRSLRERSRETPPRDQVIQAITACDADPELVYLKHLYRREFKAAFGEAMASLTNRERTLLRHQLLDGLSIDEIGALHRVHRSTAARWLVRIRQDLAHKTRRLMMAELGITQGDYESILRLISSRIELSLSGYLETTQGS